MTQPVRRVSRADFSDGVELTEEKLQRMIDALHATADPMDRRTALRLPVEGFVTIAPIGGTDPSAARCVGVYDLSRTGVAVIDVEPMPAGSQFNMLIPRADRRPIEVMCVVRHARPQGEGFIVGAQFGVSWLSAIGAAVISARSGSPTPLPA